MGAILSAAFRWLVSSEVIGHVVKTVMKFFVGASIFAASAYVLPEFFSVSFITDKFVALLESTPYVAPIYYALDMMQVNFGLSVIISAFFTSFVLSKVINRF